MIPSANVSVKDSALKTVTARSAPIRVLMGLLLLLAVLLPLGAGCGFGPQPTVPDNAQVALREGAAKLEAAKKKEAAGRREDALPAYTETAAYFGATARKFSGSAAGLQALLAEGRIYEEHLKNLPQAQTIYRTAQRQYPARSFPKEHDLAERRYNALIEKMNADNVETPYYRSMDWLVRALGGSPVLAIVFIGLVVTVGLWPLRAKQYRVAKEMQQIMKLHEPEMKRIQEKYKDDWQTKAEKMQEFQREHGIKPTAGCLPMLLQIPVTILMYQVIVHYQFQFAKHTFLWINQTLGNASADWPGPLAGAIGRNLGEHDLPLLLAYAVSMFVQTRLTPASDPTQAEQQKIMAIMMPSMFFIMMLQWQLPAAFVLYWFISNIFGVAQQWYINRSIVLPPLPAPATGGAAPAVAGTNGAGTNGAASPANGQASKNGAGEVARPLAPNQKLISPKSKKRRR